MSTIASESRAEPLYTHRVQTERRSFFFHVKRGPSGEPYMTVSQFVRMGDEWVRLKLIVPSEDAKPFYHGLCEALKALRSAEPAKPAPQAIEVSPAKKPPARAAKKQAAGTTA